MSCKEKPHISNAVGREICNCHESADRTVNYNSVLMLFVLNEADKFPNQYLKQILMLNLVLLTFFDCYEKKHIKIQSIKKSFSNISMIDMQTNEKYHTNSNTH